MPDLRAHFTAIDVDDGPRSWLLDGVLHGDGQAIRVDLAQVTSLKARRYSPGKTAAAILVPTLAVCLAVGITMGIVVATIPND